MMPDIPPHSAIKELKYAYCHHLDRQNPSAFLDLFTDDASFTIPNYGSGAGNEDLRRFIETLSDRSPELMMHQASNPRLERTGDFVVGHWYYTVVIVHDDGTRELGFGTWEDEYVLLDGTWKIRSLVANRALTLHV